MEILRYRIWAKLSDETTQKQWETMLTEVFFKVLKNSDWKNRVFLSGNVGVEDEIFHAEICFDKEFRKIDDFIAVFERELAKRTKGLLACGGEYEISKKRRWTRWFYTFLCILLITAMMAMIATPIGMYLKYTEISNCRSERVVKMEIRSCDEMGD